MEIVQWAIADVSKAMWADNPRKIDIGELNKLRRSIREFGLLLPVVVNGQTGRIVGGHQRARAAELEGLETISVVLVDLEPSEEVLLNLALNKIKGDWDYDLLTQVLSSLSESSAIELSGFDEADILGIFGSEEYQTQQAEQASSQADAFEEFVSTQSVERNSSLTSFNCPDAVFRCSKADYINLVDRIKAKVGLDDRDCKREFDRLIGLADGSEPSTNRVAGMSLRACA